MPTFSKETLAAQAEEDNSVCGPCTLQSLGDPGGLTQFGANLETLPPGSRSSIKHWHANEDELVYVLEGEVMLHEGEAVETLGPGDVATFKAGAETGHCLENRSDATCTYIVIGTRAPTDIVTYPDDDRVLTIDSAAKSETWTTHAGAPATNPYVPKAEG